MTNGYTDIKNTDMMLIMGGNPAENHPCGFKWAIEAKKVRNAKMIVVDPRFTRTAATADLFVQIRAGSDIAFLGGMVRYAIENNRLAREYLLNYTNAAFIVKDGFKLPEDGLFSGFNAATQVYDKSTWNYEQGGNLTGAAAPGAAVGGLGAAGGAAAAAVPAAAASASAGAPAGAPSAGAKPAAAASASAGTNGGGVTPAVAKEASAGAPAGSAKPAAAAGSAGTVAGPANSGTAAAGAPPPGMPPNVAYDLSLTHPRCVFQLLKRQYSRYTPEMVERVTGIPKDQFLKAADLFTSVRTGGDMKKVATVIYAVGWTQHTFGSQIIRTAAILQLLLGNVGRAGGGVNALRGHSNIQGATDMAGIFDNLPGYLKVPTPADADFAAYAKRITPPASKPSEWDSFNYWGNTPKFAVSLLKTLYGDAAKKENDWAFNYLPKVDRNYSWTQIWDNMYRGSVKGMFAFGMNGVAIGPDSQKNIEALKKADWLVVGEIYPDETSEFWMSPGISKEEMGKINTTVYRLPCAGFAEKDGSMTNSSRWLQWKNAALPPPAQARLDQDIIAQIFLKVRELYKKEGGKFPDPILNLTWPYTDPQHPALSEVAKEINGKALADLEDPTTKQQIKAGQQLPGFAWLKDDGTTACGNWIYNGSWTEAGNQMARRGTEDPSGLGIHQGWAWSWPANRRVLYNRASCDQAGKPWDPERRQVWWSEAGQKWVGNDVPDFKVDSHPQAHMGPFIMNAEGVGRLFAPLALFADGPFPEHYEPFESPVANAFHPQQANNPVVKKLTTAADKFSKAGDEFNIVCTTYRLTEHYHYWTKNNPMNVQLIPEPFIEIPVELAADLGVKGGEKLKVTSARSYYVAKAFVTRRIKPMTIDGKKVYQIGIPIHQGYRGIAEDEERNARTLVNRLSPTVIDPNAYTPEFKGFMVKVEKA
ncbi:MAG TPA: formate dehydrogenase-N subunit alpha [Thermoanaerobaculia bacterium]|jgi:formate dehydrogenase major subunit|nr:formate dehydrogenase-N subunit alpha [Thermoanaerobaculia bacterium]